MLVHRILSRQGVAELAGRAMVVARLALVVAMPVVTVILASWPAVAYAYCRTTTCANKAAATGCFRDDDGCWAAGAPLFWRQQCVSFSVSGLGSPRLGLDYAAAESLVQSAFGVWVNATCANGFPSIALLSRGPLMCERREYNPSGPNANGVLFRDDEWSRDPAVIAITTVSFNVATGQLLNADMEINSFTFDQLSAREVQYVVVHEAGHFLGLDHSPDPTAVMFYRDFFNDRSEPVLADDDLAGLCAAYPPDREVPECNFEPAKGFAADCGGNVSAACAVAPPTRSPLPALLGLGSALAATAVSYRLRRARRRG